MSPPSGRTLDWKILIIEEIEVAIYFVQNCIQNNFTIENNDIENKNDDNKYLLLNGWKCFTENNTYFRATAQARFCKEKSVCLRFFY